MHVAEGDRETGHPDVGEVQSGAVVETNRRPAPTECPPITHARLRGIKESKGDLLVFVDDDNILAADYLEQSLKIADEFPKLGALGGSIKGEFEIPHPEGRKPYRA